MKEENGKIVEFVMIQPVCYDTHSEILPLTQLRAGEKAKVQYFTTKDGMREAQSITLVK